MFVLNSEITIGDYIHVKPHDVRIEKSVFKYVDRAILKIPLRAKEEGVDLFNSNEIKTSKVFKEGMKVNIKLGYNGVLRDEFQGFISRVNFTSPLEIECEGYSYLLRRTTYKDTLYNTTLFDILRMLVGFHPIIVLEENVHHVPIPKFKLSGESGTEALEKLKKDLQDTIIFRFEGNVLHAEMYPIKASEGAVKYKVGWNVISADVLKNRDAKNDNITVHFDAERKDGTMVRANASKFYANRSFSR